MKNKKESQEKAEKTKVIALKRKMPTVDTSGRFKTKNKKHDTKVQNLLQVEDFSIRMLFVQVSWFQPDMEVCRLTDICRPCFEQWLMDTGRLDWCLDNFDQYGELTEDCGTMALEEYWNTAEYDLKCKDLKDYMLVEGLAA